MKQNIFLITVDALRADYIYEKNHSSHPFLSSILPRSIRFKSAISPSFGTPLSFRSMFTPIHPLDRCEGKGISRYGIPEELRYLPEELKDKGYFTMGLNSNPYLTSLQGYKRGFDFFYNVLDESTSDDKRTSLKYDLDIKGKFNNGGKGLIESLNRFYKKISSVFEKDYFESSEILINKSKKVLVENSDQRPFFVWIHMMETHSPFRISRSWFKKTDHKYIPNWEKEKLRYKRYFTGDDFESSNLTNEDMEKIKNLYECGIRRVDSMLEDYITFLKEGGFLNSGSVIITSDHGENLGDHGLLTHRPSIYNSVLHVPLVIYNGKETNEINNVFSTSNLFDLILDIADETRLNESVDGLIGPAISEGEPYGRHAKVYGKDFKLFSIQNDEYKIIIDLKNKEKNYYKMNNNMEVKIKRNKVENEQLSNLDNILKKHIKRLKNIERDKIGFAINKINR